jgi:hypothetical protein
MNDLDLADIVSAFARALEMADGRRPQAVNARSKIRFQPGIGPHSEEDTVKLVMKELAASNPRGYAEYACGVPYPGVSRQKCDVCLGIAPNWKWAIEVKMLRFLGDNGKDNDNMLMHILSPYARHRSALTDCLKLRGSAINGKKAVMIYGYDQNGWPLDPAIDAFEVLVRHQQPLGICYVEEFSGLIHPVHAKGRVFAWQLG